MKHVVLFIRQARDGRAATRSRSSAARSARASSARSSRRSPAEQGQAVKRLRDVLFSFGAAGRALRRRAEELAEPGGPPHGRRVAARVWRRRGAARPQGAARRRRAGDAARRAARHRADRHRRGVRRARRGAQVRARRSTRDAIMQVLMSIRDERAAPLFVYILDHIDHRGALETVYARRSRRSASWAATPIGRRAEAGALSAANGGRRSARRGCVPRRRRRCAPAARRRAAGARRGRRATDRAAVRRAAKAALAAPATARNHGKEQLMDAGRLRIAEDGVRRFAAAVRGAQLYTPGHPLVGKSLDALVGSVVQLLADQPSVAIGLIDQEIVVADTPLPRAAENFGELMRRLQPLGIERIAFERGVTPEELNTLVLTLAHPERTPGATTVGVLPSDPLASAAVAAAHPRRPHQPRRARRHLRGRRRDHPPALFRRRQRRQLAVGHGAGRRPARSQTGAGGSSTTSHKRSRRTARRWSR